ncbi:putative efflux pump mfs2 [Meyerozyma sp. JA9]|nr:putative efflux pump mfs2 [Meyerozyma sp. JA9]
MKDVESIVDKDNEAASFLHSKSSPLSEEERQYLLSRHGTLDLEPMPHASDNDPLNWPLRVKIIQLGMIAFHAFSTTFMAAGLIPSFATLSEEFSTTITACSYLTSAQIIVMGFFPLLWIPLMDKYGRRQVLLLSTLVSTAFNIGCVFSHTYRNLMICRIFQAIAISPAIAVGGSVVKDLTFSHQRGWWTGWWVLGVTLGTHVGPLIMGFVQYNTSDTRNVFIVFTVMNFVQFLGYLFLGRETVYDKNVFSESLNKIYRFVPKSSKHFSVISIIRPFSTLLQPRVAVTAFAYGITFSYANVACGVELTSLFHEKFNFNPQQIGLQFLSLIVGCILGEQLGGWISDFWMKNMRVRLKRNCIEDRLWISYLGFSTAIAGLIIYGVLLGRISDGKWKFGPLVGLCVASFGLQIVTTVLVTYAIDSNPSEASHIASAITVVRQILGFVGPFYFPPMFENPNLGIMRTYCVLAAITGILGMVPIAIIHLAWSRRN